MIACSSLFAAIDRDDVPVNKWTGKVEINAFVEVVGSCTRKTWCATALLYALVNQRSKATVEALLALGAQTDVLVKMPCTESAIAHTVHLAHAEDDQLWMQSWGLSPLHLALCWRNCTDYLSLVTPQSVALRDSFDNTPLYYLAAQSDVLPSNERERIYTRLRACGADVNERSNGADFLSVALKFRDCHLVRLAVREANERSLWRCVRKCEKLRIENLPSPVEEYVCIVVIEQEAVMRERRRLIETLFGLAPLALPVLCMLCIYEAGEKGNGYAPAMFDQWRVATVVHRALPRVGE